MPSLTKTLEKEQAKLSRIDYYCGQLEIVKRIFDQLPRVVKKALPFNERASHQLTSLEVISRDLSSMIDDTKEMMYDKQYEIDELKNKIEEANNASE